MKPPLSDYVLALDIACACIETGTIPKHGSPFHRRARELVRLSGCQPQRKRRRLRKECRLEDTHD
jgi:hypothetical protein